jgi:hypothetical protein
MKKVLFGTVLFVLAAVAPLTSMAQVGISINIGLPPPIVFPEPPSVIVLPDTPDVYVAPEIDIDLFFWGGWWWRPWEGRWYRSRYYDRGWVYYRSVPTFYFDVDPGWRGYYRNHNWYGHPWYYERIDQNRLNRNWQRWRDNRHWERKQTWGVQNYQPRPQPQRQELRQQRQGEYQKRPDVRQYQQQRQQQQRQPQVRQPQREPQAQTPRQQERPNVQQQQRPPQERVQQPPRQQERPNVQQQQRPPQQREQGPQHSGPQGRPEGGEREQRR